MELEKIEKDIDEVSKKKEELFKELKDLNEESEQYQKKNTKLNIYTEELLVFKS